MPWRTFGSIKQKLGVLVIGGLVKHFTMLCSLCKLEDELKTRHNTVLALSYHVKMISKVVTRVRSSIYLNMFGTQKLPVYL